MSTGDITWFQQARLNLGLKLINLDTDTLKLGIIKSAANGGADPAAADADPRWGAGGTTNFSSSQVATAGTSYTGPLTLEISSGGGGSQTFALVSGVPTVRVDNITLALDASGFTNGRWGIIYTDTPAGKYALAFIDFGSDRSIAAAQMIIDFFGASGDLFTL